MPHRLIEFAMILIKNTFAKRWSERVRKSQRDFWVHGMGQVGLPEQEREVTVIDSRGPVDAIHGDLDPPSTAGQRRMEGLQQMEEIQGILSQQFHLHYPLVGIHISQIDFSQFQILTAW